MKFNINKCVFVLLFFATTFLISCKDEEKIYGKITSRLYAGGETTVFQESSFSFSTPASNLSGSNLEQHFSGDAAFEQSFVTPPALTNQGLGPIFNNNSCISCHPKDGRAPHPRQINSFTGLFLRASIPGVDQNGGPNPVPGFGGQIQQNSVFGTQSEGDFDVVYTNEIITLGDGSQVTLRKPTYNLINTYIPLPAQVMLSPRIGPPVFGLGLLEAVPEARILALADEADTDGDGISGKPNYVWNFKNNRLELGRFGWKGVNPTVLQQCAGAYNDDMGVTNPYFSLESSYGQSNNTDTNSNDPELDEQELADVTFYCRTLGVPAPRDINNLHVRRGEKLFGELNCTGCHTPKLITGYFPEIPEISNQVIFPFSDGLLHDMGEGLADNRPSFEATGKEWKTRPLWGIGLTKVVGGHTDFLHDGRARNLTEAILWHGGEALNSTNQFKALSKEERADLIKFLESL
jgi:CxxC motif-containing protein (DUF1111 family)